MPERYRLIAVLLGALTALGPLGVDMYLPAFPAMGEALGASPAAIQRTLATFLVGMAVGQVAYGALSDRIGRRRPLFVGMTVFVLASIGCAVATSVEALMWLRLLQALGGCVGVVVARAMVRDLTDERGAVRMMAMLMLVMGAAPILAPMLGGWLMAVLGWRAIFWALAIYGSLGVLAVVFFLPESLPPEKRRQDGPMQVVLVYASILRDRRFLSCALAGALPMIGLFAYLFGSPHVLMEVHGLSPTTYGMAFGSNALGLIVMSQVTSRLVRRYPPAVMLDRALLAQSVMGVLAFIAALSGLLVPLLVTFFLYLSVMGMVLPLAGALAMGPLGRVAGSASALIGSLQFGSGALVGVVLGAFGGAAAGPMGGLLAFGGLAGLAAHRGLRR